MVFRHEQEGKVYAPVVCGLPNIVTAEICTVLLAGVLGQVGVAVFHVKNMVIHKFPHHGLRLAHPHDHTRPPRLSFALAMVLTINSQRFQRTHPFRGMGDSSLNAPKDVAMGLTCLAPIVNQIQWLAQGIQQWMGQLALAYLKLAPLARTDLPTYATLVTHESHSLKNDDSILHTHHVV